MPCKETLHGYAYKVYVFMQLQVTKLVDVFVKTTKLDGGGVRG